jgi:hypothetical protein
VRELVPWAAARKRGGCLAPVAALLHLDMPIVQDVLTKIHAAASPFGSCLFTARDDDVCGSNQLGCECSTIRVFSLAGHRPTGLGTGFVTLHLPTHKQHVVALARMTTTNVRHCPLTPTRAWQRLLNARRFSKGYRHPELDAKLTKQRLLAEARAIARCKDAG